MLTAKSPGSDRGKHGNPEIHRRRGKLLNKEVKQNKSQVKAKRLRFYQKSPAVFLEVSLFMLLLFFFLVGGVRNHTNLSKMAHIRGRFCTQKTEPKDQRYTKSRQHRSFPTSSMAFCFSPWLLGGPTSGEAIDGKFGSKVVRFFFRTCLGSLNLGS